jgi:hypothetical protein
MNDSSNINILSITTLSMANHIYPFIQPYADRLSYDISKLAQWEVVFQYAADIGLSIILNLNEDTITDNEEQYLYVREMVARFGQHVAAYTVSSLQTAQFIHALNGNQNMNTSAAILWKVDTKTEIVSLSDQAHSVDGIFLSMSSLSNITLYDSCQTWKQTNPQISIVVSEMAPIATNTNQWSNSSWIWSSVFAGGIAVIIDPSRNNNDKTKSSVIGVIDDDTFVLNDPYFTSARTIWNQRFASMAPVPTTCNSILVSSFDLRCLSDATLTNIAILFTGSSNATDQVRVKQQFWSGSDVQYRVEWINPTTGTLETTGITAISSNQTGLGTPPSPINNWIALLQCFAGCAI